MEYNPLLLCDFYKTTHSRQYPKDMTKVVSYFTPRMSRINCDKVVVFGLQGFIKTFLTDYFERNFFSRPLEEVVGEYSRILSMTLGKGSYDGYRVAMLHNLGYLPIEIKALPEGTLCPLHVPFMEISNTHPDFAWVTNAIESLLSAETWHSDDVCHRWKDVSRYRQRILCSNC